jgi:hypothetical protein
MSRLRLTASLAAQIMAVASVAFMLRAAHRNPSMLLIVLMATWVVAPFAVLLWAIHVSRPRNTLYMLTLVIGAGTLTAYTIDALGPPRVKAATVFVLVPLISWVLSGIVLGAERMKHR